MFDGCLSRYLIVYISHSCSTTIWVSQGYVSLRLLYHISTPNGKKTLNGTLNRVLFLELILVQRVVSLDPRFDGGPHTISLVSQGTGICDWISQWQPWERCEEVGGEHMVLFGVLVRFTPGSNFPTGSVVDTEKDSSCFSGWPSLPQLTCMPLTGTPGRGECCTVSMGRVEMGKS